MSETDSIPRVRDYNDLRHRLRSQTEGPEAGKRREGVIFGAESLAYKLFVGLGPVLAGLVIDFAGIAPETPPGEAPPSAVIALGLGQGGTMTLLLAVSLLFLRRYDLTHARHTAVMQGLAARGPRARSEGAAVDA
ncbi:MAG: hypothetical protein GY937_28680 [bacterium]|nr:hypothetical protein [bacterium]